MDTTVNFWQTLAGNAMAPANPCDLMDQGNVTIPPKTGFLWKLGGSQEYGLYFPNGADIAHNSGFVSATLRFGITRVVSSSKHFQVQLLVFRLCYCVITRLRA